LCTSVTSCRCLCAFSCAASAVVWLIPDMVALLVGISGTLMPVRCNNPNYPPLRHLTFTAGTYRCSSASKSVCAAKLQTCEPIRSDPIYRRICSILSAVRVNLYQRPGLRAASGFAKIQNSKIPCCVLTPLYPDPSRSDIFSRRNCSAVSLQGTGQYLSASRTVYATKLQACDPIRP
jgi:hypothetical protein